jgi:hypothetical protein
MIALAPPITDLGGVTTGLLAVVVVLAVGALVCFADRWVS